MGKTVVTNLPTRPFCDKKEMQRGKEAVDGGCSAGRRLHSTGETPPPAPGLTVWSRRKMGRRGRRRGREMAPSEDRRR